MLLFDTSLWMGQWQKTMGPEKVGYLKLPYSRRRESGVKFRSRTERNETRSMLSPVTTDTYTVSWFSRADVTFVISTAYLSKQDCCNCKAKLFCWMLNF